MTQDSELLARIHIRGVAFIYACFFIFSSAVLVSMWPPPVFAPNSTLRLLLARDLTYLLFVPVISYGLWNYKRWSWWLIVLFNLVTSAFYLADYAFLSGGICRDFSTTVLYRVMPQLIVAITFFIPQVRDVLIPSRNSA